MSKEIKKDLEDLGTVVSVHKLGNYSVVTKNLSSRGYEVDVAISRDCFATLAMTDPLGRTEY